MPIIRLNKPSCRVIREKFENFAAQLLQETGVALKLGAIRYDESSFRATMEGYISVGADGESADKIAWDKHCVHYGLQPEDFGKTVTIGFGRVYKLVGLKPRNRKYPIIGECHGKRYKVPAEEICIALTKEINNVNG